MSLAGCVTLEKTLPSLAQGVTSVPGSKTSISSWAALLHGLGAGGPQFLPRSCPHQSFRNWSTCHSVILGKRATENREEGAGGVQSLKKGLGSSGMFQILVPPRQEFNNAEKSSSGLPRPFHC